MASPQGWWMPLVKLTRKHGLMSSPLMVKLNSSKSPQIRRATRRYTSPYLFIIILTMYYKRLLRVKRRVLD